MDNETDDKYISISGYTESLNRIQYRVELTPDKRISSNVGVLTEEKKEILKKIEKNTFKTLEDNWACYKAEEVSICIKKNPIN